MVMIEIELLLAEASQIITLFPEEWMKPIWKDAIGKPMFKTGAGHPYPLYHGEESVKKDH